MTSSVIDRARVKALNNDHKFHVAAALYRRKSLVKIGVNTDKTHPNFHRIYSNGEQGYSLHAEMNVLRYAQPGDHIVVMRWGKSGDLTMAKPCPHCMRFIRESGISTVTYTNWNGEFKTFNI